MSFAEVKWGVDQVLKGFSANIPTGLTPNAPDLTVSRVASDAIGINVTCSDTMIDSATVAYVDHIIIRRSTTKYPESITDGELVVDLGREDLTTYATTKYKDSGLTEGNTYYYTAFAVSRGNVTSTDSGSRGVLTLGFDAVVTSFKAKNKYDSSTSTAGIKLTFDIDDNYTDGDASIPVGSLIVVRKTGSYPINKDDGTTILTVETSKLHSYNTTNTGYLDQNNVSIGTTYYYQIFPVSSGGVVSNNIKNRAEAVEAKEVTIYGFKIAKSNSDPSTRVTYTEDAAGFTPMTVNQSTGAYSLNSWANTFIVEAFRPVMLKYDGTVDYELNHDDQTKKLDGTASDISNTSYGGNAMVEVAKMWFKRWDDGTYEYCNIADAQVDDDYKCYAHMRDANTELDFIYLPMFEGSLVDNKLRSIAGQAPINSKTGTDEITYATANGANWYTDDWMNKVMMQDILTLLGKSTNHQATFGNGHYSGGSSASSLLTTGTLKDKGMFYGTSSNVAVKFFWLENYYADRFDRVGGMCTNDSTHLMVKPYRPYKTAPGDITAANGYVDTGVVCPSGAYISQMKMTEYGLLPVEASGSDSTYYCDYVWSSSNCYALVGGDCNRGLGCGSFCLYVADAVSDSYWNIGASLSFK